MNLVALLLQHGLLFFEPLGDSRLRLEEVLCLRLAVGDWQCSPLCCPGGLQLRLGIRQNLLVAAKRGQAVAEDLRHLLVGLDAGPDLLALGLSCSRGRVAHVLVLGAATTRPCFPGTVAGCCLSFQLGLELRHLLLEGLESLGVTATRSSTTGLGPNATASAGLGSPTASGTWLRVAWNQLVAPVAGLAYRWYPTRSQPALDDVPRAAAIAPWLGALDALDLGAVFLAHLLEAIAHLFVVA